jgi:hypothetical protein
MDERMRKESHKLLSRWQTYFKSALVILPLALTSCVPSQSGGSKRSNGSSGITNTPSSVNVGYGRILHDNPIILSGNASLSETTNLSRFLKPQQDFITNSQFLKNGCGTITECYEVKKDSQSNLYQATDGKWAFDPATYEFMQVQMYADINSMVDKYVADLSLFHNNYYFNLTTLDTITTSMPRNMLTHNSYWPTDRNLDGNFDGTLLGYALCEEAPDNAFYSPSENTICLGFDSIYDQVKFVHDPTVLYHELGHALVVNAMNLRNRIAGTGINIESNLGYFSYDEGKSINEGIADFFSYYMNGRAFLGEWAFGRFLELGRPMVESDPLHAPGVSESPEGRLSYPTFLSYNPNSPTVIQEDVHNAGQIISHFLVAFTKDVEATCGYSNTSARSYTFKTLVETLAYLGDLTSAGMDVNNTVPTKGRVNHSQDQADEWLRKNKSIDYRRFSQTFARFVKASISSNPALCNGIAYNIQRLEQLLDSYGLLLFKNYDLNGSLSVVETLDKVNELNRQKSVLIKKNQLFMDNRSGAVTAYIFDGYDEMNGAAKSLSTGIVEGGLSSSIFENSNLKYNNGNGQISPGELVGVLLNLYNNSNSDMAGLRILANDWKHMDQGKACNNFTDNFPSESQGGVNTTTNPNCAVETQDNLDVQPVCFFQDSKDGGTVWVSQEEFMTSRAIEATECLGGASSTKDCLIRSPKGADVAWYSKLDPKKTWIESFTDENGNTDFKFSSILFFEVSPSIPPGTTVNCRLRATFTNCDDCHTKSPMATGNDYSVHATSGLEQDGDEYKDYKYSGADPFVIINYQFTIID